MINVQQWRLAQLKRRLLKLGFRYHEKHSGDGELVSYRIGTHIIIGYFGPEQYHDYGPIWVDLYLCRYNSSFAVNEYPILASVLEYSENSCTVAEAIEAFTDFRDRAKHTFAMEDNQ